MKRFRVRTASVWIGVIVTGGLHEVKLTSNAAIRMPVLFTAILLERAADGRVPVERSSVRVRRVVVCLIAGRAR
jgi:hypothetical protein